MRNREQIEKDLTQLQTQYNSLCAQYGDTLLKIRYWNEQKDKCEKDIDKIGDVQKELNFELECARRSPSKPEVDAGDGQELHQEDLDK